MAIDAKFTRTLPAPTATISSGFVFLLSAGWFTDADLGAAGSPIGGGANSLANGGGDMQIFSDTAATTRLPIEVVTFVTGGSPDAQVWVRTPSYTSGDTITIGRDDTQTTQPAVGAAFGRNAVWVDYEYVFHFELGDELTDATGNYSLTKNGTINHVAGQIGDAADSGFSSFNYYEVSGYTGVSGSSARTHSGWFNVSTATDNTGLVDYGTATNGQRFQVLTLAGKLRVGVLGGFKQSVAAFNDNFFHSFRVKCDGSSTFPANTDLVVDGNLLSTTTGSNLTLNTVPNNNVVFTNNVSGSEPARIYDEYALRLFETSASQDESEYNNQSDPDNFGTSSEWVLVGGGGISGTITQTVNSFTQSLVGTVVNPTTTGIITQTAQSFTQAAIGTNLLNITGTITQSASAFTQSLSGNVTENITGVISQSLSSFTQSLLGAVAIPVTGNINQTASSFTQSAIGVVPIQWTDKTPASTTWTNQAETVTNWTDQSGVSTIWTDKV